MRQSGFLTGPPTLLDERILGKGICEAKHSLQGQLVTGGDGDREHIAMWASSSTQDSAGLPWAPGWAPPTNEERGLAVLAALESQPVRTPRGPSNHVVWPNPLVVQLGKLR